MLVTDWFGTEREAAYSFSPVFAVLEYLALYLADTGRFGCHVEPVKLALGTFQANQITVDCLTRQFFTSQVGTLFSRSPFAPSPVTMSIG